MGRTSATLAKAQEMLGQLDPSQLTAVVRPLETFLDEKDDEELTAADRAAIQTSLESLEKYGTESMEEVLADFG